MNGLLLLDGAYIFAPKVSPSPYKRGSVYFVDRGQMAFDLPPSEVLESKWNWNFDMREEKDRMKRSLYLSCISCIPHLCNIESEKIKTIGHKIGICQCVVNLFFYWSYEVWMNLHVNRNKILKTSTLDNCNSIRKLPIF